MTIHDPVTLAVWVSVLDVDRYPAGRVCEPPPPGSDPLNVNDLRILLREVRRHDRLARVLRGELVRLERALEEADTATQ